MKKERSAKALDNRCDLAREKLRQFDTGWEAKGRLTKEQQHTRRLERSVFEKEWADAERDHMRNFISSTKPAITAKPKVAPATAVKEQTPVKKGKISLFD